MARVDAAESVEGNENGNDELAKNILSSLFPEIEALKEKHLDLSASDLLAEDVGIILSSL
ncbi:MAG: hypothetical protein Q8P89_03100 [bacterium]|nr:hypothetical protein [bacterium]